MMFRSLAILVAPLLLLQACDLPQLPSPPAAAGGGGGREYPVSGLEDEIVVMEADR